MIVLGIDPGLQPRNPTGWATINDQDKLDSGIIVPVGTVSWEYRVPAIASEVRILARRLNIAALACEDAYLDKNVSTFRQLVCFGWQMRMLAQELGVPFVLVNPSTQHATLQTFPPALLTDNAHQNSARAIAWEGRGVVRLRAMAGKGVIV